MIRPTRRLLLLLLLRFSCLLLIFIIYFYPSSVSFHHNRRIVHICPFETASLLPSNCIFFLFRGLYITNTSNTPFQKQSKELRTAIRHKVVTLLKWSKPYCAQLKSYHRYLIPILCIRLMKTEAIEKSYENRSSLQLRGPKSNKQKCIALLFRQVVFILTTPLQRLTKVVNFKILGFNNTLLCTENQQIPTFVQNIFNRIHFGHKSIVFHEQTELIQPFSRRNVDSFRSSY